MAGNLRHGRRILLVAANDPTAASGLGLRLRTTIAGLAQVGPVDVVAFGGEPLVDASKDVAELFAECVGSYSTPPRLTGRPRMAGELRWLATRRMPRPAFYANRAGERVALPLSRVRPRVVCEPPRLHHRGR